jgi:hypothetical protein
VIPPKVIALPSLEDCLVSGSCARVTAKFTPHFHVHSSEVLWSGALDACEQVMP